MELVVLEGKLSFDPRPIQFLLSNFFVKSQFVTRLNRLFTVFLAAFLLLTQSCAAEAEKLPGKIVFRTDRFGEWVICTLVDGKIKRVYDRGGNPKWSPDARKIAIAQHSRDWAGIIVFDENTKSETRYPTEWGPFLLDWLPDAQAIVFSSDRRFGGKQETGNVFRFDLNAKTTTQLTFFDDGKSIGRFALSPDGKKMVFMRYRFQRPDRQFYIGNSDGSNLKELELIKPFDPDWSPDGKKIVYTSHSFQGKETGRRVLSIYDFESNEEKIILEEKEGQIVADRPVFSPDGTQILFSRWSGLFLVNIDGTGLKTILPPKRLSVDESSSDVEPDWTA
jgi:dipeptidyl aminopeptidase/acylaminoacyl peptidase